MTDTRSRCVYEISTDTRPTLPTVKMILPCRCLFVTIKSRALKKRWDLRSGIVPMPASLKTGTSNSEWIDIGHFSVVTQKKIRRFIKRYCNDLDIKLVFSSFTIGNMFCVKDPIPAGLRSRMVYKFACAGCNACYVGETTRHFSTRVREHLVSDKASHIFKHLQNSERCRPLCSVECFDICVRGTRTQSLICVGCSLHFWCPVQLIREVFSRLHFRRRRHTFASL